MTRATNPPCDDVVADFVQAFFSRRSGAGAATVAAADAESVTVKFPSGSLPRVTILQDSVTVGGKKRDVSLAIIRCRSVEHWVLLPVGTSARHVTTLIADGSVTFVLSDRCKPGRGGAAGA